MITMSNPTVVRVVNISLLQVYNTNNSTATTEHEATDVELIIMVGDVTVVMASNELYKVWVTGWLVLFSVMFMW